MADPIDRQAAIDAIEFGIRYVKAFNKITGELKELFKKENDELREAVERVKELPPAQSEPRWIPCSERLPEHPENNDYYLVTIQCEHHDGWDDYVTGFAEWTKHGWDELSCYIGQIKVIAWMPLPEPYKEVNDG